MLNVPNTHVIYFKCLPRIPAKTVRTDEAKLMTKYIFIYTELYCANLVQKIYV